MPIHVRISHQDRLLVAVAHGTITREEFLKAAQDVIGQGALHYRKILDVAAANSAADLEDFKALQAMARSSPQADRRGPVAFVVDAKRGDLVREFVDSADLGGRPIKIFTSLHEARRWLDEVSTIQLKR
jgi:hypothetical protein